MEITSEKFGHISQVLLGISNRGKNTTQFISKQEVLLEQVLTYT